MNGFDLKCRMIEEELQSIWPDWHVVRRLGGGAFGDVYQIYRENFEIRVDSALKVIRIGSGAGDNKHTSSLHLNGQDNQEGGDENPADVPEAFRSEIQIMEALRGAPNIVAIEDFYYKKDGEDSLLFVRMELLTSLQDVLSDAQGQTALSSIREISKFGRDICTALMYCENKGIIHRDIKPENLFVDRFGDYKVGDFGASKRMDAVHAARTMTGIGTLLYMAPEVFQGLAYNNTVDIYSLGLVLYQFLNNGRIPFLPSEGNCTAREIDIANNRRLQGFPLPSLIGKNVGGEQIDNRLDAVVQKACAANPLDRYQTAKEFYDALLLVDTAEKKGMPEPEKNTQVLPETAASPRSVQNEQEKKRRSGAGRAAIIIALLLVLALGAFVLRQRGEKTYDSSSTSDTGSENTAAVEDDSVSGTISDSWEEIIASGDDGSYLDKYRIGDTKVLDLGEEGLIEMELVAFDADELADGSGQAHMTWISKDLLNSEHAIDLDTDIHGQAGWLESKMRVWLRESVLPLFPETVRTNIKNVKKNSYVYEYGTYTSADTIWIPSKREMIGTDVDVVEDKGPVYSTAFPDDDSRKKQHLGNAEPSSWWLRSAAGDVISHFYYISTDGSTSIGITGEERSVAVGFCL